MAGKKNARLFALAAFLVFASTTAVLVARQLGSGPARPAPAWRTFGPATAAIEIYEYTDFACPACRHASKAVDDILKIYPGGVRLSFKHYPLTGIHPWSAEAAAYADCAGEQGRFHEYATLLFESQELWGRAKERPEAFAEFGAKLGLDAEKLAACAASPDAQRRVRLDMAEGDLKGVSATPTFFVNGKRAVGAGQLLDLAKQFDKLLTK